MATRIKKGGEDSGLSIFVMKWLNKKVFHLTAIKYLFSYLLILSVLLIGFYYILRTSLTDQYYEQLDDQAAKQLEIYEERLNEDIINLHQINQSLVSDIDMIVSRYKNENWSSYETMKELRKYDTATRLVDSIVYRTEINDKILSTLLPVQYEEEAFVFQVGTDKTLVFESENYLDASGGQLVFLKNENTQLLLYFPKTASGSNYMSIMLLDTSHIQKQLSNLTTVGMPAIALVSPDRQIVCGVETQLLEPHMESLVPEDGIYRLNDTESLCVQTGIGNGFMVVSLRSNDILMRQINHAFASAYLILFLLGVLGFMLVLLAMRITWLPLHRLTKKVSADSDMRTGYIEQLDKVFSSMEMQNEQLKNKLEKYRFSMQKALLESSVMSQNFPERENILDIERFFEFRPDNELFVIIMKDPKAQLNYLDIQETISDMLPEENLCSLLQATEESAAFLLNYTGPELQKEAVLKEMLKDYYEEYGYFSAISSSSGSALDVPSLYNSASAASKYWPQIPVADDSLLKQQKSVSLEYPHEKIKQLTESLKVNEFAVASRWIDNIFEIIDCPDNANNIMRDFFIKSVLVDILTIIAGSMDHFGIKFKDYKDLYFETLFFCRSCSYDEKQGEVKENIKKLLGLYEEKIESKVINAAQIRSIIEESYCQPEFSISVMADHFQIGVAYMSSLVKKELGINFSDYLWSLRLEKAKKLLRETNLSIDKISVEVGYLNTSSFRRKFKQDTGNTPSWYRENP